MTASEKSYIGLARQTAGKGNPNNTDAQFTYVLFRAGSVAPQNVVIPLDMEVGGGATLRSMVKTGVTTGGALDFIPRPASLGKLLYGVLGKVDSRPVKLTQVLAKEDLPDEAGEAAGAKTSPPAPTTLNVTGYQGGAVALTGNVLIDGLDGDDEPLTDVVFALSGNNTVTNAQVFKTVTSVNLPAKCNAGDQVSVGYNDSSYKHTFTHDPADQFSAPYWTIRSTPGALLGERFQDCRVANLVVNFAGGRFVDGAVTFVGGLPTIVSTAAWSAASYVDAGPQFLGAPGSDIELPTGDGLKVLSGSIAWGCMIPLDEQWIVGSYTPDDFDINQKSMVITYNVKITSGDLYEVMMYDPAQGGAWLASLYKEADLKLYLESPDIADTITETTHYSLNIAANAADDNVIWSAAPVAIRAGRQVILTVTGVVVNAVDLDPITVELINQTPSY